MLVFEDSVANKKQGGSTVYSTQEWSEITQKINDTPPTETFNIVIPRGWGREIGLADPFSRLVGLLRTHCNNLEGRREVRRYGQKIQISAVVPGAEPTRDEAEVGTGTNAKLKGARRQPSA